MKSQQVTPHTKADTESSFPKPDQGKDADSHYHLYTIILGVTAKE